MAVGDRAMTTTTAATPCAQLVYTSASRTLEGAGFGVVLKSRDWPAALGDSRSSLGSLIGFEDACFGLLHRPGGRLAYSKLPADTDGFGRPGNYVVHLLWDKAVRLTPREVLAFQRSEGFLASLPADFQPSAEADGVAVPSVRRSVPVLSGDDVDELAGHLAEVLAALGEGSGVASLPERTASGCPVPEIVFAVLPRGLMAPVSLHVGSASPMGDTAPVAVLVGAPARSDVVVTADDVARARALLDSAARRELCPDSTRRLADLDRWLFVDLWAESDPESLSDAQLVAVLGSEAAGSWLLRHVEVATAVAASSLEVDAALRSALDRHPEALDRLRDRELTAALSAVFDGGDEVPAGFTGLTEGELCEAFTADLDRGRRVRSIGPAAALFVEESLSLGYPLELLRLTDDHEGLARLATKRPVVRAALVREWDGCGGAASACTSLLGHLLVRDIAWVATLGPASPEYVVRSALTWASARLDAARMEDLAVTVASGELAGQGWALRDVLFVCKLPDDDVADIIARNYDLLARDDGWPRGLAKLIDGRFTVEPPAPAEVPTAKSRWRRRRPD